jgi:alpha-beta hydrolase superfamily lysophospholipase
MIESELGSPRPPIEIQTAAGRKQPVYFGAQGRPLLGFYHPPREGPWRGVGVVLCPPVGADRTRSDRTYRHLAERLANAGFACLRFDLFGTGDSGGDESAPGLLDAWLDDVGQAIREVRARSGAETISLVGLRLGATLAMLHAAESDSVDSLVLWSPYVSGAGFLGEVTKLHKVYLRLEPALARTVSSQAEGREALGMLLPQALVDDLSKVDLLGISRRPARRTLFVDGGNVQGRDALMGRLQELGSAPELRSHPGHKFLITVSHRALIPDEILDSILGWLVDAYPATIASRPVPASPSGASPSGERPLRLGMERPLFGILTPADPAQARADRPPILVLNAGCVNRSGVHRMSVRMARRWASLGFDVLRVDLSGIGDSPAFPGAAENVTYPTRAFEDISEAIRALGAPRVIVAGHCSGGDYAFQVGARDPQVAGVCILNPRTFCVLELSAVEGGEGAPVTASVADVPRTLLTMAERGVDTLLLVSPNDPGVAYVDAHAAEAMRALANVHGFRRIDVAGTDHAFTPVDAQARVIDALTEHLLAHY